MTPLDKIPDHELDEMVSDVRSFANSKACDFILATLQQEYVEQLLAANVGDLTAASAHASMKVLRDFRSQMDVFHNEQLVRNKSGVRSR